MRCGSVVALLVVLACKPAGEVARSKRACGLMLRQPSGPIKVMTLQDNARVEVPAACDRADCLVVHDDVVVVLQPDNTAWATWAGEPGRIVTAENGVLKVGNLVMPDPATLRATRARPAQATEPALPPELRTCGTTTAGGGLGWHIIRNKDNVWQRIHWARPPSAPEVQRLGPDAYPIASSNGTLCATGVQRTPRHWDIHLLESARVVPAAADHEHPPAACLDDGSVRVQQEDRMIVISPDGQEKTLRVAGPLQPGKPRVGMSERVADTQVELKDDGALSAWFPDGSIWNRPAPAADRDLGGNPIPTGAVRRRIVAIGDARSALLVAERFELPDCRSHQALHRLDLAARNIKSLTQGDVMMLRPGFGMGAFYWLEAEPRYRDLAREETTAEF